LIRSPRKLLRAVFARLLGPSETPFEVYYSDESIEKRRARLSAMYDAAEDRVSREEIQAYLDGLAMEEENG
jgi:hypothetical protein